jgi:hypothetical protein
MQAYNKNLTMPKTNPSPLNINEFIARIPAEQKKADCKKLITLFQQVTGEKPMLWGSNMIGFGEYHYCYASGHKGDAMLTGFAMKQRYSQ